MNTGEYVNRLLTLGWRHGQLPIYGSPEWEALDNADPRRFASVVRAAEAWRRDGTDQAVREHTEHQLFLAEQAGEQIAMSRLRQLSWDLSEATDWANMADSIDRARRAHTTRDAGYQQPQRTPDPWTPEQLDKKTWRVA